MNLLVKKNNLLQIDRGDYIEFPIEYWVGKFPYGHRWTIAADDIAYFGIMLPNTTFDEAVVKKELTVADVDRHGNLVVSILPEDTLELLPGTYYYEVKVLSNNCGEPVIKTIVQKTKITIH